MAADARVLATLANDLAAKSGIDPTTAMRLLLAAGSVETAHPGSCTISHDEYSVLQRIALMAGALLPHMRRSGIALEQYAAYSALRDALVELQVTDRPAWAERPLATEDIIGDLQTLKRDLSQPPPVPPTP